MPTDVSLAKIILMCSVTELANPQFAFSTNWNLYHQIFNSEPPFFCHLKWLDEILGTTNFRSWQFFYFFLNQEHKNCTTQNHSPTDLVAVPTALVLRTTTIAGHRCCEADLGDSSLHRCETLSLQPPRNSSFGTLLPPLWNPSFGTLPPPLRNPSFGTLLLPLRNPNFGTLLQLQFSRLVD